jgi:transposase
MTTDLANLSREDLIALVITLKESAATQITALQAELAEVTGKLDYVLKKHFAPSSEKRPYVEQDGTQQSLFGTPVQQEPEPPAEKVVIGTHEREKAKKPGHGRQGVSLELEPEERIVVAAESEKIGPDGEALVLLGYEISEKIDLIPERLRRLIIKREKWGLADTRETLYTAPVEPCLIPRGKATDAFVLEVILNKFHLALPLHRQLMDFNHLGAQLSDSFLSDLVKQAATTFRPIWCAQHDQVLSNRVVFADETPIRQLIDKRKAAGGKDPEQRVRTSYFWAWLGGGQLYLHYGLTRGQEEVREVLGIPEEGEWDPGGLIGFLVTDGYAGYNPAVKSRDPDRPPPIRRVACWAHVRRRFLECADRGDTNAKQLIELINELFRVERRARKEIEKSGVAGAAADAYRLALRRHDSVAIVAEIKRLIDLFTPFYTPSRDMAEHLGYTCNLWDALTLFLDHGDLPTDNNASERAIRPLVVGRKNWLFVGSEDAGEWAAIFYSLIESCRMLKLDPRRYLTHVTPLLIGANPPPPASLTPLALRAALTSP